jgi:hypothetical protein
MRRRVIMQHSATCEPLLCKETITVDDHTFSDRSFHLIRHHGIFGIIKSTSVIIQILSLLFAIQTPHHLKMPGTYHLYIANKKYSSSSLRPWLLLGHLSIPFEEHLHPFKGGHAAANHNGYPSLTSRMCHVPHHFPSSSLSLPLTLTYHSHTASPNRGMGLLRHRGLSRAELHPESSI